jgi:hypothetical protein
VSDWHDFFTAHYVLLRDLTSTGIAALGVITTSAFAIVGLRTFGKWKREKIEEKRMDVAIDALAIAYEAQLVFERIRSRRAREFECKEIMDRLGYDEKDTRKVAQQVDI